MANEITLPGSWQHSPHAGKFLAVSAVIAGAYLVAGKLGLALAISNPSISTVWAPSGIAFSALLVFGFRYWPAILAGAFLTNLLTAGTVPSSLAIAAGNTLEAVLGVYLVNRFASGRRCFERPQTIFRFVVLSPLLSSVVSAVIGVSTLSLLGMASWDDYRRLLLIWWTGDAVGTTLIAPALAPLWCGEGFDSWTWAKFLEAAALITALVLTCRFTFVTTAAPEQALGMKFIVIPFLLWAAIRFGMLEGALAVLLVSGVAISALNVSPGVTEDALLQLQIFMGVVAVMTAMVATMVAQHKAVEKALRGARDELAGRVEVTGEALSEAVAEMQRSEMLLSRAQQLSHTGSFHWDTRRNRISWSEALYHIHGITPAQFDETPEAFLSFVHPEDALEVRACIDRTLRTARPFRIRQRIIRPDGEVRFLDSIGEPAVDDSGRVIALYGVCRDRTEEQHAETALRASEANFRGLLEQAPDAVIIVNEAGKIVLVNAQTERLFGYHREELQEQAVEMLVPDKYRHNHPAHRSMYNAFPNVRGVGESRELYARRKDGSEFPAEISLSPLRTPSGLLISCAVRDITERRQAEEAMRELTGRLIRIQEEERSRIGRELHDDLSQQLALLAIRMESVRKLSSPDSPRVQSGLKEVGEQINEIIESVHRISHAMHSAVLEQLGLVLGLRSLIGEFIERRGIAIEFDPDPMPRNLAPEVSLCVYRVVQEALNNIAKHSRASSARIELRLRDDGVHLRIEDFGVGFDSNELSKTGLGFISMRERLRLIRGSLNVRSAPGEGTRIDAWVPLEVLVSGRSDQNMGTAASPETPMDAIR